jgi:hypothetical protein
MTEDPHACYIDPADSDLGCLTHRDRDVTGGRCATALAKAHPEYTAGALSFLLDGTVQVRRGVIVQCPALDGHTHAPTDEAEVKAKTVRDPEVGLSWIVTASGPDPVAAMEAAYQTAASLGELLRTTALRGA